MSSGQFFKAQGNKATPCFAFSQLPLGPYFAEHEARSLAQGAPNTGEPGLPPWRSPSKRALARRGFPSLRNIANRRFPCLKGQRKKYNALMKRQPH